MYNKITIQRGKHMKIWSFKPSGGVAHVTQLNCANPVMKWLFHNKPIPSHENGIIPK